MYESDHPFPDQTGVASEQRSTLSFRSVARASLQIFNQHHIAAEWYRASAKCLPSRDSVKVVFDPGGLRRLACLRRPVRSPADYIRDRR